jgi:hypothetical protein
MSATDVFAENFDKMLREIPAGTSLPEVQFLYRKVIVSMGLQILKRFEKDAAGPDPSAQAAAPNTGDNKGDAVAASQPGGPHPHMCSSVTQLAAFALCMQPVEPS